MERLYKRIAATALTLFFVSVNLFALSVLNVSEKELAQKADLIVIGRVLSAYSEKDAFNGEVFTYISVRVGEHIKGTDRSRDLMLKTIGGTVKDQMVYVPGAADFYRNEEVLLFLERRPDGSLMPMGMALGKYSVYRDSESGQKIVLRQMDGNGRYFSDPRSEELNLDPGERVFLNEFRSRIQKFVRERREK